MTYCSLSEPLSGVTFILFDLGKHPIKFSGSDLGSAKLANTGRIYFQGRPAIGTIEVGARRSGLGFAIANKSPVFTPTAQVLIRPGHYPPVFVYGVIISFGKNA